LARHRSLQECLLPLPMRNLDRLRRLG
jgi:hypothetical protein